MDKKNWTYKKLGKVGDVITGSTPSTKEEDNYNSSDVCFVKPSDIPKQGIGFLSETEFYISRKAYNNSRKLPKGSVLTTCIGIIGKVGILNVDATCNQQINAIIPHSNISSTFLAYSILSKRHHLEHISNAPVVPIINKKEFSNTTIPIPPLAEQERIVAELDLLSSIIDKKKAQLKELDQLAQSIFYDMFGDPTDNPMGWKRDILSNVCETVTDFVAAGSFADLRENVQYIDTPDYAQLIRTVDLKNGFLKKAFIYVNKHAFDYLWRVNLNKEAIILPNVGVNCGEVYYVNPSLLPYSNNVLGPNSIMVRSNHENHIYLSYFFQSPYFHSQIKQITNAVGQPKYNKTELKKLYVIVPPLSLQQEFANKIEAIEQQKSLIQQSIKETETLFNSRMDYYFN